MSKVGAVSEAQKAQSFQQMPGRFNFYVKLRKRFRDTQRGPYITDKTRKPPFLQKKTKKNVFFFCRKMSHSAEQPKQSSMLAKRFISSKSRGF